jgi:3-deoxy-D-manno-octulosonic-acid transferase
MTTLALYRGLTTLMGPLVVLYLARRRARGKEDGARFGERLGRPGMARPAGPLVWLHAASVGEAASLLALIDRLTRERPLLQILVTTGTVASAGLLAARLPHGKARHQYVPVDRPRYIRQFLDHWKPDLAIWVYAELWPNLIATTQRRGIPTILLNGRMSQRSFARWHRWRSLIAPLLGGFSLCLAQDGVHLERLQRLGARAVDTVGDLRSAAAPLPADGDDLARLAALVGDRPSWLAASTHPGEEDAAASAHLALKERHRRLLTFIVPRHPARADEIATALAARGLVVAQRSRGEAIAPDTEIYLGDTLGEMGLFYRLAEIAFVGGSTAALGGHNPLEPALLGCAVLHGPDMSNWATIAGELAAAEATVTVADAAALAKAVDRLLADPAERRRLAAAAAAVAQRETGVLDAVLERLAPFLDKLSARVSTGPARDGAQTGDDLACA